jgi:type II secretory ATPase GspE/PulE/Tfp pilus assembly ATPase PilB-like protein
MIRWLNVFVFTVATVALLSTNANADWPVFPLSGHDAGRGPGFNFAIYKILLLLPLVWGWVFSTERLAKDAEDTGEKIGMPYTVWTPVLVFPFLVGLLVVGLLIPIYPVTWLVAAATWLGPVLIYVVQRNGKVPPDQRLLTSKHLKEWFASLGKAEKKDEAIKLPWQMGAPVNVVGDGPDSNENQSNAVAARQAPAYVPMKELLADGIRNRAYYIMLDYTADAVAVRYQVDGVWHNGSPVVWEKGPLNREIGDQILAILKKLAGLNPAERRLRQEGKLKIDFEGIKLKGTLSSQGTPTGERVAIQLAPIIKKAPGLDQLGMREKMREQLKAMLAEKVGLTIISSLPGDGLTTTWNATLSNCDRLLRDFVGVEDKSKKETEVENVDIQKYDAAAGETAMTVLPKLALKQPEVFVVPEISDSDTLNFMLKQCEDEQRMVVVSTRAREGVEALMRVLALNPSNPDLYAKHVRGVLNVRLIRRLCEKCKEAIPADPNLLARLGIPPGRVQQLYIERQPLPPGQTRKKGEPEVCPQCRGIGYYGRTAIYELLQVPDAMRQYLSKPTPVETLRAIAKQSGHLSLLEEGVLLVAVGTTSIQELQRVLKQG